MIRSLLMQSFLLASIAALAGTWRAEAQRISGEIRLQVTDVTGSAIQASGRIVGQATGVERTFELRYEEDRIRITVDGKPLFDVKDKGKFAAGRFGFYNYGVLLLRHASTSFFGFT